MFAEVLLPQKVGAHGDTLTYKVPEELAVRPGHLVEVPLRNRSAKGIVYRMHSRKPAYPTRPITRIVQNAPHLEEWQIRLMDWISEYYFCPLYKALKLFMPVPFVKKKKILEWMPEAQTEYELKKRHALSEEQKQVLQSLKKNTKKVSLLHGITGSGKTEIYLHLADQDIHEGKQVLLLIPEISLTPQTVQRFQEHFDHKVAVIHSQLTSKEKEHAWMSIHKGDAKVVIGSRSAIFAPFQNLGRIILDEEHDSSYKQDQSPRYNTMDVAKKVGEILSIPILAGSATPTLESYHHAQNGEYELLKMNMRPGNKSNSLPRTKIVDLRDEMKKKNYSIFSDALQDEMAKILGRKEQAILFLNRRGAASAVICRMCGYVVKCDHCDVPMTYHKKVNIEGSTYPAERLICHHCGKIEKVPSICPICKSPAIRYIGLGTQRVEDELEKLYPKARILRADRDTTQKRGQFKQLYEAFKKHKADVLIGTQMIAIGLHLPKVNLVGVILADLGLTIPNYRSAEYTFQIITQVAGRAGRCDDHGEVIIQTYLPNNYAIQAAAAQDYEGFYEKEMSLRKELGYPPFNKLIKLTISLANEKKCIQKVEELMEELERNNTDNSVELTSYPSLIPKLKNKYRWHVLLTGKEPSTLLRKIKDLEGVAIDVDPLSTV